MIEGVLIPEVRQAIHAKLVDQFEASIAPLPLTKNDREHFIDGFRDGAWAGIGATLHAVQSIYGDSAHSESADRTGQEADSTQDE